MDKLFANRLFYLMFCREYIGDIAVVIGTVTLFLPDCFDHSYPSFHIKQNKHSKRIVFNGNSDFQTFHSTWNFEKEAFFPIQAWYACCNERFVVFALERSIVRQRMIGKNTAEFDADVSSTYRYSSRATSCYRDEQHICLCKSLVSRGK